MEFAQYRSYEQGDELRQVDWKLYARSDRFFVRESERESPLAVWLLLDATASAGQADGDGTAGSRLDAIKALAACVADQADSEVRSRQLAAAKFVTVRAARLIAEQAIQLHGGIGMTWEYSLAHHAKRLIMLSHQLGDDDHHLQAYAQLLESA